MSRLPIPTLETSPAASRPQLEAAGKALGVIPNLFRLIGLSPAALEAYLGVSAALSKTLDAKTRERIALAVAEVNGCNYCLSAHSYIGANLAKLSAEEIILNRRGRSSDAKADVAVAFARKVAETRGHVADADLAGLRQAGFTDAQIVEIIVHVALNVLTNFVNNVADTEIDFPTVQAAEA